MTISYAAEKFSDARRMLMLPHPHGEAHSIANAFAECDHGLSDLNISSLSDDVQRLVAELKAIKSTVGLTDPDQIGLYKVKAALLTEDERFSFSTLVDELAYWFGQPL